MTCIGQSQDKWQLLEEEVELQHPTDGERNQERGCMKERENMKSLQLELVALLVLQDPEVNTEDVRAEVATKIENNIMNIQNTDVRIELITREGYLDWRLNSTLLS